jgi:hypothetical protein
MSRPLPEEIMAMDESETACQYCGISYLILNKCEKMEALVREMERERDELRVRRLFPYLSTKLIISTALHTRETVITGLETSYI